MRARTIAVSIAALAIAGLLAWWLLSAEAPAPVDDAPPVAAKPAAIIPASPIARVARPGFLFGIVTREGVPQSDATVRVTLPKERAERIKTDCRIPSACQPRCSDEPAEALATTVTQADGTFTFADLPPGPFTVWADHVNGTVMHIDVVPGGPEISMPLMPWREVSGLIRNEDEVPVANVRIRAVAFDQSRQFETATDAEGRYLLRVGALGFYVMAAGAPGYYVNSEYLAEGQTEWSEPLGPDSTLTLKGIVTRLEEPVAGATVVLTDDDCRTQTQSAFDGTFSFAPVSANSNFFLRAESGGLSVSHPVDLDNEPFVELELMEPTQLRGVVQDPAGKPIAGAKVTLQDDTFTVADVAGKFALDTPLRPPWELTASADGFAQMDLTTKATRGIVLKMVRERRVRGVVRTPSGELLAGARVTAPIERTENDEVNTDTDGGFELFVSEGGPVTLVGSHPDYASAHVRAAVPSDDVTLVLKEGLRVSGRVVDEAGNGVGTAIVSAMFIAARGSDEDAPMSYRQSDTDGGFTMGGLTAGKYRFIAESRADDDARSVSLDVVLPTRTPIELKFPGGGSIQGVVRDGAGNPLPRVSIEAELIQDPRNRRPSEERGATSGPDGTFVLRSLVPGDYSLQPSRAGYVGLPVRAAVGDTRVELRMKKPTIVSGRVITAQGKPVRKFELWGEQRQSRGSSGSMIRDVVTLDGRFTEEVGETNYLVIRADKYAQVDVPLEQLPEGNVALGDLVLPPLRSLTLTLVDATTSSPLAGVWLHPTDPGTIHHMQKTDANGTAEFADLDSRPVAVRVSVMGSVPMMMMVPANVETATLRVERLPNLRGRLDPAKAGMLVSCAPINEAPTLFGYSANDGSFALSGVTPGRCVLTARYGLVGRPIEYGPMEITAPKMDVVLPKSQ